MNKHQKINIAFTTFFVLIVLMGFTWFFVDLFRFGTKTLSEVIMIKGADSFMDFFNSIRDAKDLGVYPERGVIYPALANCIYFIFGLFIPKELINTSFPDRYHILDSALSYMALVTYFAILFYLYIRLLKYSIKDKKHLLFCMITTFLSFPFIFAFERANMIMLAVIALMAYFMFRDSEDKKLRELAYIGFGVSFGLKLYPIFFILIPLCEKKYKEVIKLTIYSLVFLIVPFFFYGGINAMFTMLRNILSFSDRITGGANPNNIYLSLSPFLRLFVGPNMPDRIPMFLILVGLFIVTLIANIDTYLKVYVGCMLLINVPGGEHLYSSLFYIIPLFMLLNKENKNLMDFVYLPLIIILFLPIPISFDFRGSQYFLYYIAIPITNIIMSFLILGHCGFKWLKIIHDKTKIQKETACA